MHSNRIVGFHLTPSSLGLIEDNSGLDSRLVPDALESFAPLLELERFVNDTLGLDLAAVEVVNSGREHEGFRERADDGNF